MNDATGTASDFSHAVVMLHGLCGTPLEMGSIPKALERLGYTVSSLEIADYSANLLNPGVAPRWEDWCDTVEEEASRLLRSHDTVSICGLSMGSTLALATAIRRSDILALVALSPVLRYDGWSIPWYTSLLDLPYALGIRNWSYKESEPYGLRNIEMRRRVARSLEKDGVAEVGAAAIPARQLAAAKKMMAYVRGHLNHIQSRLAVIHAVDDETAAPKNAEIIMRNVSSEVRKVIWLGDSYHIITFDNEREVVLNEAVRFLSKSISAYENDTLFRRTAKLAPLRDRVSPE